MGSASTPFRWRFDAAVRGLGVVLGRSPLVDGDIESGRLVPLAGQTIPSGSGYWLVTAETEFQKPEVKLFRRWLLSELGAATSIASQRLRARAPRNAVPDSRRSFHSAGTATTRETGFSTIGMLISAEKTPSRIDSHHTGS